MKRPTSPIACAKPLATSPTAADVAAMALSMIRGKAFGSRSTEVKFLLLAFEKTGFLIVRRECE